MTELNSKQQARRRLLKTGIYIPPAILGIMIALPKDAQAATITCGKTLITISAFGTACCPCAKSLTSTTCQDAQCALGNCASCSAGKLYNTQADCLASFAPGTCCSCVAPNTGVNTSKKKWLRTCP